MKLLVFAFALASICLFSGCTDCGPWKYHKDGSYGPWWWHDKAVDARYEHPSEDAPESLKSYYDADLTRRMNQ